ncbi:hypothetical protein BN971_03241 [Mycobacterium bohemicum DSM 44277]|uniref:Uncharacterized protein n=1 Tax=Mycobacterium bohemicum DSM 44277 TaxID=1236609 RepID=A0A0U0WAG1_MYCBE|nr:hypothetical protein [Mycobacterium bohemicum]MCV6968180.1 hypothetical protein [Mycobacterium bohemicum]CPR11948.1 hypothetical protein BN971_03241 [Mycobacterium bohemicum DSM 44277]
MRANDNRGTVLHTRQLRDGRQLAEIRCPHCAGSHWYLNPGHLVDCLAFPNRPLWVDGLGAKVADR